MSNQYTKRPAPERFWEKVEKGDGCWIWRGTIGRDGYGDFWIDGRNVKAHSVAYCLCGGIVPPGWTIDHLCRNRACVNPDHMEVVTRRENTLRGMGVTAVNARKVACPRGHPYTPENTRCYTRRDGCVMRHCRECGRIHRRAYRARQRKRAA